MKHLRMRNCVITGLYKPVQVSQYGFNCKVKLRMVVDKWRLQNVIT